MRRRPVIGITPTPSTTDMPHGSFYRYCLSDTYIESVRQAGGNPVILPCVDDDAAEILDSLDGLILSGGGDVDPALLQQEAHKETGGVDERRDSFELALMRAAAERDMPTLAICRGIQVMAVAFGGDLHQHVPDVVSGDIEHRQHQAGYTQHEVSHVVTFENSPNPVSQLVGAEQMMTNSFHHQALAEVPAPLRLAGRAADGTIEAIWHPDMTFGIGVQWHPEMLALNFPDHAKFFSALVAASRQVAPTAV